MGSSSIPPQEMKEQIISFLRSDVPRPVRTRELAKLLKISKEEKRPFEKALDELLSTGDVVRLKNDRIGLPERMNLVVGILRGNPKGFAFLIPSHPELCEEDVYIPFRDLKGAMHGDKVIARVDGHYRRGLRGEVIRILDRAHKRIVGHLETKKTSPKGRPQNLVIPDNPRIFYDIPISGRNTAGAKSGEAVVVELISYPEEHQTPEGKVVEILGHVDEPGVDIEVVIRKYELPTEFPKRALEIARKVAKPPSKEVVANRLDLRHLPIITIDPEDAKDHDDAVYVERTDSGYRLGVHIADVSNYVKAGTALDQEAYERGTSVYLVDRVIPMIPENLSNDMCSLREGEDRLAMSAILTIDSKGNVTGSKFHNSVIRVRHRMSYSDVWQILSHPQGRLAKKNSDIAPSLRLMSECAKKIRKERNDRGALDLDLPEAKVILNEDGSPADVIICERNEAHRIIEDFMIAANEAVARFLHKNALPTLYRIHEPPNPEESGVILDNLAALGYEVDDDAKPKDYQAVLLAARGKPEEILVNKLILRSLQEARYHSANRGHFGLASDCYLHFTSPIRRYPDLLVHRGLKKRLESRRKLKVAGDLTEEGVHCSQRERAAEDAERESIKVKQVKFIHQKLGEEFDAIITGVHSYGFFTEISRYLIEGLVRVSSLEDDYYNFDERGLRLVGSCTGRTLRLGDKIRVQVIRVDLEALQVDFQLVVEKGKKSKKLPPKPRRPRKPSPRRRGSGTRTRPGKSRARR